MKRALLDTLWIGALAGGLAIALQLRGLLARPSLAVARAIGYLPNEPPGFGNFVLVLLLAFAVAWAMLVVTGMARRLGLFLLLLAELAGAAWVLSLYKITFPPLPAAIAVLAATLLAMIVTATSRGRQRRRAARLFGGRLSQAAHDRLAEAKALNLSEPIAREATFVFCEIANETELIDKLPSAECARLTREFIEIATASFLEEGGYLHAADGEGIRVLFGFPGQSEQHAVEAARASLAFRDKFRAAAAGKPESLGKIDLRVGISSGTVVATVQDHAPGGEIVVAGEPLEEARRLARANRTYGSQILLGPRSYSAAGKEIVARPIDFLRGLEAHERLEVYELLALTARATPEVLARRDHFWTAIVYFREKRWNESFAEFSRAQGENEEPDLPLQWYLSRLEPLCLKMATEPGPVPGEQLIGQS